MIRSIFFVVAVISMGSAVYAQSARTILLGVYSNGAPSAPQTFALGVNPTNVQIYVGLDPPTATFSGAVFKVCDVATGLVCADATASAGTVTLPTIGGLLCNNIGNQCNLSQLYDTSGQTNCNLGLDPCHFLQSTNSKRPLLFVGTPNYMIFDGSSSVICQGAAYGPSGGSTGIAQPFTVSIVLNQTGSSTGTLFGDNANIEYDGGGASGINMYTGSASLTQASTHGNWYAAQYVANNASSTITVDASPTGGVSTGTSGLGNTFCLGAYNSSNFNWPGKVREWGLWSGAVGNTTNQAMIASQAGRGVF